MTEPEQIDVALERLFAQATGGPAHLHGAHEGVWLLHHQEAAIHALIKAMGEWRESAETRPLIHIVDVKAPFEYLYTGPTSERSQTVQGVLFKEQVKKEIVESTGRAKEAGEATKIDQNRNVKFIG